jgi:hypothetical protein
MIFSIVSPTEPATLVNGVLVIFSNLYNSEIDLDSSNEYSEMVFWIKRNHISTIVITEIYYVCPLNLCEFSYSIAKKHDYSEHKKFYIKKI